MKRRLFARKHLPRSQAALSVFGGFGMKPLRLAEYGEPTLLGQPVPGIFLDKVRRIEDLHSFRRSKAA